MVTRSSLALSPSSSTIRRGFGRHLSMSRRFPVTGPRTSVPALAAFFFSNNRLQCRLAPSSRAAASDLAVRVYNVGCSMPERVSSCPLRWQFWSLLWLPRVPCARARFRLSSLPSTWAAGLQQKFTWPTPMKIPIRPAGASAKSVKHPVHAVHLVVPPVSTPGGATWSCSAHLSSTWLQLPRSPIPSNRLIQRQEGESSRSVLCCTRRNSRIRQSPSRTIGPTIVPSMQTHIGRFTAPVPISTTGEAAVP